MAGTVLALGDVIVNEQALALAPTLGWLLLAAALSVAVIFIAYADRWRSWWLSAEDPRGIAVFRIVFGFFVLANINGMWEHFEFLYTDEGIFTADVARNVFASKQFAGFGDGMLADEPWGFFDAAGLGRFLAGCYRVDLNLDGEEEMVKILEPVGFFTNIEDWEYGCDTGVVLIVEDSRGNEVFWTECGRWQPIERMMFCA